MTVQRRVPLLVLVLLLLSACAGQTTSGPAPTVGDGPKARQLKRVLAAVQSNPPTISSEQVGAGSGTLQGGDGLEDLLNAGIGVINNRGNVVAQLAEEIPSIENGLWNVLPDGRMETTWHIRPQAQWHDGVPVTTADPLFTIQLGQDRDLPLFGNPGFDLIESISSADDQKLTVRWKQPYIQADRLFTRQFGFPRPAHVLRPAYQQNKESVPTLTYWNEDYVGTGPFKVRRWVAGTYTTLEANDAFVLGRPNIDEIEVRFIPDSNALAVNILAGEVEVVLGRNLSLKQAVSLRERWTDGKVAVGINNWMAVWPQLLNPNPPALLDVRFRRALYHAIDRPQLVETLEAGMVPVAHTFVSPTEPVYKEIEPGVVTYDYDPRRTAQLLEEIGFSRGADGLWHDGSGQPLAIEVRTDGGGGDDEQENGALAVDDAFRRVGISSSPHILSQPQRLDRELNSTYPGVRVWRQPNDIWTVDRTPAPPRLSRRIASTAATAPAT